MVLLLGGGVSQESEVIYEQESDFTVTIPKKITLGSDKSAEYAVTVRGSVCAGESVSVIPDSEFTMNETGSRKSSVKGVATQDDTVWNYEQIEAGDAKSGNVTALGLTAGEWSGSLKFNINLDVQEQYADITGMWYSQIFSVHEVSHDDTSTRGRLYGFNHDGVFYYIDSVIEKTSSTADWYVVNKPDYDLSSCRVDTVESLDKNSDGHRIYRIMFSDDTTAYYGQYKAITVLLKKQVQNF